MNLPTTLSDAQREVITLRASNALMKGRLEGLAGMDAALSVAEGDALLPCPFCGDAMVIDHDLLRHIDQGSCIIGQIACGYDAAQSSWNTRTKVVDPRIAELEAEIVRREADRPYVIGWNEGFKHALRDAAKAAAVPCYESRHVKLGDKVRDAIISLLDINARDSARPCPCQGSNDMCGCQNRAARGGKA